jgi:uncharacterized protein YecT (DUF1311 family)
MPQVNLSTLSGPALRRLLDATREHGKAALSYQILQEMAARREGRARRGLFLMRRPAEPRIIALDLDDPTEHEDEGEDELPPLPAWRRPPSQAEASASSLPEQAPGPAPRRSRRPKTRPAPTMAPATAAPLAVVEVEPTPPPLEPKRPRSVWEDDPDPPKDEAATSNGWGLRSRPPAPESLRPPRRLGRGPAAGFAVGAAMGVALGWWVGGITRDASSPPAAPVAAPARAAGPASPPAPAAPAGAPIVAEFKAAPETPTGPAVGLPPTDFSEGALSSPDAAEVARDASAEAMELPAPPPARGEAEAVRTTGIPPTAQAKACAAEPTPADRTICGVPDLRRLQGELRQAYAEALEAHQDRALLRERQLAWASARNTVSDPDRLAALYEERIRKLNAATAAARQQR